MSRTWKSRRQPPLTRDLDRRDVRLGRGAAIHPTANVYDSSIGAKSKIAAFVEIGGATIGERCKIQAFSFVCPGTVLEDEVFVGPHVCFTNDRYPRAVGIWSAEPIRVGRGASIGAGSILLPGVTIGARSMVAAGSIVRTSIPEGCLFEAQRGAGHVKRWYARQEDIGLPLTFDEWRDRYDGLSPAQQSAFYDAVGEKFPEQEHGTADEARRFFRSLGAERLSVLELGGWDGRIARLCLDEYPNIASWWNYEISARAVALGARHPRYTPVVEDEFLWNLEAFPSADVFFSAHCIEHIRAGQLERLASRLTDVSHVYLESPLPESATNLSWSGRWNTHILEIGWEQVEAIFHRYGFEVRDRAPDVRTFSRRRRAAAEAA